METVKKRRRVVVDDSALAAAIGGRLKRARLTSGQTQSALAGDRYTKAYISALEHGIAKPSMAALNYLAPRLGTTPAALLADVDPLWDRVQADLALASSDWTTALDRYEILAERTTDRAGAADIKVAVAECLCRLDRGREAVRPASEAAEVFADLDRETDRARADYWLASAHHQSDNLEEARSIVTGLLSRARDGLDVSPDFRLRLLVAAAMVESNSGNPGPALAYLEEARGLTVDLDDRRRAEFLGTIAVACREDGDIEGAIRHGQGAITLLGAAQADEVVLNLENELAMAYLANGNLGRAADLAHEARLAAIARKDGYLAAHVAETEAQVALASGDPEAAVALIAETLELAEQSGNQKARMGGLVTRARAQAQLGRHEDAATDFELAAELASDGASTTRRRQILSAWADSLAALGQHDRAFALAREALDQR
jgi:transcriptional regulator with XRE-family HTH domain